jgi:flagellar biosynthesis/type III secretory pathway M-ring protein FliF/YscJ
MFEDLNWSGALKRAGLTVLFYLVLVYVLNIAIPGSYGGPYALALNAAFLFVLFTLFHAYIDRRRRRREAQLRAQRKGKKPADAKGAKPGAKATATGDDEEAGESDLKGRQNPNTSRRKATRRRR